MFVAKMVYNYFKSLDSKIHMIYYLYLFAIMVLL